VSIRGRPVAAVLATAVVAALAVAARTGAATPPPTPIGPSGSRSPFPTALHTPKDASPVPGVTAAAAVLEDLDTGQVLFAKAAGARRPVASLTKMMTALLALERLPLSRMVTVRSSAASEPGATLGLRVGERLTARDLLTGMLLASADDAAVALGQAVAGSVLGFVDQMNARARELGLRRTHFTSPDGFDNAGLSTGRDLAILARTAMRDPVFDAIVRAKRATVRSLDGPVRVVQNRNVLLWLYPGAIGIKTGFTTAAGHCVAAAAERGGVRLLAVVLGAQRDAFSDAAALLNHGFAAFRRTTVVGAGRMLGTLTVGATGVQVAAAAALAPLVPTSWLGRVTLLLREAPGLRAPIAPGTTVGTVTAFAGRMRLGSVPAVAAAAAPARRPRPGPSGPPDPLRAAYEALRGFAGAVFGGFL
jgi:D-alanyl-D-alanine carboxypeptidase (penicillin-binding protein 5/6)